MAFAQTPTYYLNASSNDKQCIGLYDTGYTVRWDKINGREDRQEGDLTKAWDFTMQHIKGYKVDQSPDWEAPDADPGP